MEKFLKEINTETRSILKNSFQVNQTVFDRKRPIKKKFTTVINPEVGNLYSKMNGEYRKMCTNNQLIQIPKNFNLSEKQELILNKNTTSLKSMKTEKNLINLNGLNSNFQRRMDRNNSLKSVDKQNNNDIIKEKEKEIDLNKLMQLSQYSDLETKKVEFLYKCYQSFTNILMKDDFSNIINGFEIIEKLKLNPYKNKTLLTEYGNSPSDHRINISSLKFSREEFAYFDNLRIYRMKYCHSNIKNNDCEIPGIIAKLGIDYNIFIMENLTEQIAILDILILNLLGILKSTIVQKLLELLIFKQYSKKSSAKYLTKNIKKVVNVDKIICVGFIFSLINDISNKKEFSNVSDDALNIYKKELELRKINKLSLNITSIKQKSQEFQLNFKGDTTFEKRKVSLMNFIRAIDKDMKILDNILIINQHIYDFILLKNVQDIIIEVDQFAYRVFLEFRNFLFEFQDKMSTSPDKKIFKSLADKQLLQYSSRNLANKFYFWKPNVSVKLNPDTDQKKEHINSLGRNSSVAQRPYSQINFENILKSNHSDNKNANLIFISYNKTLLANNNKNLADNSNQKKSNHNFFSQNKLYLSEKTKSCNNNDDFTIANPEKFKKQNLFGFNSNFYIKNKNDKNIHNFHFNESVKNQLISSNQLLLPNIMKNECSENSFLKVVEDNPEYYPIKKQDKNTTFFRNSLSNSNLLKFSEKSMIKLNNQSIRNVNGNEAAANNKKVAFEHFSDSHTGFIKENLKENSQDNDDNLLNNNSSNNLNKPNFRTNLRMKNLNNTNSNENNKPDTESEYSNSSKMKLFFNLKSNSNFKDKLNEDKKIPDYNHITHSVDRCNLKLKTKYNLRNDTNNSAESYDSNDDLKIMPYNIFANKISDLNNPKSSRLLKKPNIINIHDQNLSIKNKTSKHFYSRKKLIINRNKFQ